MPDRTDYRIVITLPVQWGDQDLFGHVNNTVYFRWFETARVDYLNRIGLARLHGDEEHGPILAHIACNYRRQLTETAPAVDKPPAHRTSLCTAPRGVRGLTPAPRPMPTA